jgi:hypothetical protein
VSEVGKPCDACGTGTALRRYCSACSPRASALYKRDLRSAARASGEAYWLEWWVKAYGDAALERRRSYQRGYMRAYRKRQSKSA